MGKKHKMSSSRFFYQAEIVCNKIYGWDEGKAAIAAAVEDGNYYPIESAIKKAMSKAYTEKPKNDFSWLNSRIISDTERNKRYRSLVGLLSETRRRARLYGK